MTECKKMAECKMGGCPIKYKKPGTEPIQICDGKIAKGQIVDLRFNDNIPTLAFCFDFVPVTKEEQM